MIVEDEKEEGIEENLDLNETPSTVIVDEPEFSPDDYVPFQRVLEKDDKIRDRSAYNLKVTWWSTLGTRTEHS